MMKELQDLAGQHDYIAESLSKLVLKDVQTAIQEMKQERKRVYLKSRSSTCLVLNIYVYICTRDVMEFKSKFECCLISSTRGVQKVLQLNMMHR